MKIGLPNPAVGPSSRTPRGKERASFVRARPRTPDALAFNFGGNCPDDDIPDPWGSFFGRVENGF